MSFEDLVEGLDAKSVQGKGVSSDTVRVSVSSSSHGSAQDDTDALGDVYVWGEVICESSSRASTDRNSNATASNHSDVLLPKLLESDLVLDVHNAACGVRHAALLTKHGEIFTWGEEFGGRLGQGIQTDIIHPRLVESLSVCSAELVACGEFHTCAVTAAGELYTWGDGAHNVGLLGNGNNASHWIPKRVSGPLDGFQVTFVTCGTWHTALITSNGQLFTFGDGTFGVLGHGNRENVPYPREVESLIGLRTISVACGVWHTAAVVEVIVAPSSANTSSGKLFTWGDGDKYRLGQGDKDPRLKPTCVPSLIDYNFHKIACGHSLTIGLTTSGNVFTMGSAVYGQLGCPNSDGKLPSLVEDKLSGESVVEVACGSYHVVVCTAKSEIYSWGKGANGRLGHGDLEDRMTPTLVEALKDRTVKRISCGSNFTAAICIHKWVSGAEQSQCSACRQSFGFTRKRHNCYNCGLVHCHACSSRKVCRAALAPNPDKPYRVCDTCYTKLNKVSDSVGITSKRNVTPRLSGESKDKFDKVEMKMSKVTLPGNLDMINIMDIKASKQGKKAESLSSIRSPLVPSLFQLKDDSFNSILDLHCPKQVHTSATHSVNHSRAVSPFSRKSSPPRSTTPIPTIYGLTFSRGVVDGLKKKNELLNLEIQKLHSQVENMRHRYELQEFELQKSAKKAKDAMAIAAEESAKSKAAKDVIKSLTVQLKDMAEKLRPGVYESGQIKPVYPPNGAADRLAAYRFDIGGSMLFGDDNSRGPSVSSAASVDLAVVNGNLARNPAPRDSLAPNHVNTRPGNNSSVSVEHADGRQSREHSSNGYIPALSNREAPSLEGAEPTRNSVNGSMTETGGDQVEAEWIEQYDPGVYITLVALRDGTRDLKRVRFSRRRFGERQAEIWWSENRDKVYDKYNVRISDKTPSSKG